MTNTRNDPTESVIARNEANQGFAAGKKFGRPSVLSMDERAKVIDRLTTGIAIAEIAREFKTTRQTIMRVKKSHLIPQ